MSRLSAPAELLSHSADGLTDDELVEAVRSGNEAAFAQLFDRHSRFVARLASRFLPRHQDVEGIVQDTFTEAFLDLDRYRGAHERSFVAWLRRITVTTCYDSLRRARLRGAQSTDSLSDHEVATLSGLWQGAALTAEQSVITRDLAVKLLARLAPADRLVLTLLSLEELSVTEIAELTGWSESKVKVRAHRARKTLRAIVERFL
jgi:RNA polymerase sigma-70 factor (ECF subfamily)